MSSCCEMHVFIPVMETLYYPFKRQFHKMVKHNQTIRRQFADELFEYVLPCCGVRA